MENVTQPQTQAFPQEVEVNVKIRFQLPSQEDRDYLLKSSCTALSNEAIADVFDALDSDLIVTVNGYTKEEIQKLLNSEAQE